MDVGIYNVIKGISVTDKSRLMLDKFGKITFIVNKNANKPMIREAVERIWDVKIEKISVVNTKGKTKTFARRSFKTPGLKKAIITLKEGYKLDLPGQFESMGAAAQPAAPAKNETGQGK